MLCHAMVSDRVMWWPEYVQHPLPQEKSTSAAQLKLLFGHSCCPLKNLQTCTHNNGKLKKTKGNKIQSFKYQFIEDLKEMILQAEGDSSKLSLDW